MTAGAPKYIYFFDESDGGMSALLGGKGSGLAEMTGAGLPVPSGFTITTQACLRYGELARSFPPGLDEQIAVAVAELQRRTGKELGSVERPLLVSVRSGAAISMPGMMDTVLNLGLNDETVEALVRLTKNERFAWDAYRRFVAMFGDIVLGVNRERFSDALDAEKRTLGIERDPDVDAETWKRLVVQFKAIIREAAGRDFPAGLPRAASFGGRSGVRLVELASCDRLSPIP